MSALACRFVRDRLEDAERDRADELATRARGHLREGGLPQARRIAEELRTLAEHSDAADVRVRALLLDASIADAEGRSRQAVELRRRASAVAQGGGDPQARVDSLAVRALDVSPEAATEMLALAEGAAREPEHHSFVAAVRAIVDASDPEVELPEPEGPHAQIIRFAHSMRRLERPAPGEPPPIDCTSVPGTYARGVCFSISAGVALQEERFAQAATDATESIRLLGGSGRDRCESQVAYVIRGVAALDLDSRAAEADLEHALTLSCPDDPPEDLIVIGLMHARALLRLGHTIEADALADEARPFADRPDVAEGLSVYEKERARR